MEFSEIHHKAVQTALAYCEQYHIEPTDTFAALKMHEEVGEFAQALLIHKKLSRPEKFVDEIASIDQVAQELADIIGMALFNAHVLGIDVEKAIMKKWVQR